MEENLSLLLLAAVLRSNAESTRSLWDPATGTDIFTKTMIIKVESRRNLCESRRRHSFGEYVSPWFDFHSNSPGVMRRSHSDLGSSVRRTDTYLVGKGNIAWEKSDGFLMMREPLTFISLCPLSLVKLLPLLLLLILFTGLLL